MALDRLLKSGYRISIAWEQMVGAPQRKGHKVNIQPPSFEAWQDYHRAKRMQADLSRNPCYSLSGYEYDEDLIEPESTYDWEWLETEEEWLARLDEWRIGYIVTRQAEHDAQAAFVRR